MLYSDTSEDFKIWYQGQLKSMSSEQKAYKTKEGLRSILLIEKKYFF